MLNDLSYQQARNHGIAVRGVYVAYPGCAGPSKSGATHFVADSIVRGRSRYTLRHARVAKGSVVLSVNGQETPTLDDFVKVLSQLPHGAPLAIRHYDIGSRSHVAHASTHLDRKWFQPSELRR